MRIILKIVFIFSLLTISLPVSGQKERNNIYLFDCTGSMIKNGLWNPAKSSLDATLTLDGTIPGTQVTVIPFGDNPYGVYKFEAKDYSGKRKALFDAFEKHIKEAKYTHITEVLEEGLKNIDNNKENRLYLLTDGQPNQGDTPDSVAATISRWCSNHKNTKLIYAALAKGAVDETIRKALENCPDAILVEIEGNVIPQFADVSSNVYTNLEELSKPREIDFSLPGSYEVKALSNDSLFNVEVIGAKAVNGKIKIIITTKDSLPYLHQKLAGNDHEFLVNIQTTDQRFRIVNPEVRVHVEDKIPSKVSIAEGYGELVTEGVKWYDSFLWSPAKQNQQIVWDLNPIFENELKDSSLKLRFTITNGDKADFKAWYNDKEIKNGDLITINPGEVAFLTIQFNHNAQTGKRYFELQPVDSHNIDMVNNFPVDEYQGTSLRTSYNIGWNPLATCLFWIGIGLLILLILWFLFLQRIFYPRIKVGKIEMKGPDTYYQSKKIKGARKVVLTSQKKKQNIVSKIFTGEVRYVKAEHFSPEIAIIPAAGKKKVKVTNTGKNPGWDIYPTTIFKQYDQGSIKNRNNNQETNIEFS